MQALWSLEDIDRKGHMCRPILLIQVTMSNEARYEVDEYEGHRAQRRFKRNMARLSWKLTTRVQNSILFQAKMKPTAFPLFVQSFPDRALAVLDQPVRCIRSQLFGPAPNLRSTALQGCGRCLFPEIQAISALCLTRADQRMFPSMRSDHAEERS